ncbi:ATP-binding protein [Bowmanella denitrificans]
MQALFESEAKEAQIAELEEQNQMLQLEQQVSQKRTENAWLTATLLLGMLGAIALWAMLMQREKIRLAKLSQQLTVARRQAEAATEAKSAFLARMSHEIRTPINAVTGLSRLALDSQNEREQRGHLVNILDAGEILLRLVDDILDFSRIEAGKLSIECVALTPRELLKSTLNMHIVQANAKGLALVEDIAADMPRQLLGDPWRIKQILNNLVGNAIKFTEQGTVTVRLCANPAPDQPDLLMLEGAVSDTGIGLSQDQQDALFQSFSQADDSITRRFGGTGLGLAICKQLCDLMGGRIWVESEPGHGSTFRFELPLKRLAGNPQPCQDSYLPKGIPDWSQYRLLLVEDNEVNRQVAIGLLQKTAIEIQVAEHGQQALDRLKDEFFDLVLMDIQMPVMDGLTAAILIRQDLELQLPIIAMTAHAMEADRQKSVKAGMDGHLAKPIDTQTLYSLLGKYLHTERYFSLASPDAESNEPTWQVEQLAGLNVKQAIARLGGNPQLYQSLLGAFFRDQNETARQLRQLLAQHDHSTLFRLIHSLKSSSAYIGASGLSAQCGALEAILEQGPCDPKPLLKVADDLEALLNTLAPVFESSDQSSPQAIDESELRSQLQQILALLKQSDFMVEEKLAALQKLLAGGPYAEQIARLVKKVDDVEYERAGELVTEMLAELQDAAPHHKLKVLNP